MPTNALYNEQQLLLHLKEGDEKAFRQLYDQYYTALVYFAHKFTLLEEAEDIVIDVLSKFWQLRGSRHFDHLSGLRNFLYTSVRNACLDYIKKQNRQKANQQQFNAVMPLQDDATFQNDIYDAELIARIYTAVEELPNKCRTIFKMAYFEGKGTDEIARVLNITPSTVFNQKARAIQLLKLTLLEKKQLFLLFFRVFF